LRWPELIAPERRADLGLDAPASALLSRDGVEKGVSSLITAALEQIAGEVETGPKLDQILRAR
jgi:hypothetical protein